VRSAGDSPFQWRQREALDLSLGSAPLLCVRHLRQHDLDARRKDSLSLINGNWNPKEMNRRLPLPARDRGSYRNPRSIVSKSVPSLCIANQCQMHGLRPIPVVFS